MVLFVGIMVSISSIELIFTELVAEKLSNEPEKYFVVTNPDPMLLQAISHPGVPVPLRSLDETEFNELSNQYGTNNVEYQNNYYSVGILNVEPTRVYYDVFLMSLIGFVVSTILLISYAISKGLGYVKKRKEQQPQVVN